MHIPDGFLDTKTVVATGTLSLVGVAAAWQRTKKSIPPQRIPMLGVSAAFVFAAQMLNFPVAGGTSGHLMGAALASVLLGPHAAILVVSSVLVVQCFLFADGGILALGANVFNMAILGSIVGAFVYRALRRLAPGNVGDMAAIAVAAWVSVVLSSICCAGELAWSGIVPWHTVFPAMAGVHALIGVGEALITCLVVSAIKNARPELLTAPDTQRPSGSAIVYALLFIVGLVLFVSPFVSPWPDGLERVAASLGFDQRAVQQPHVGIIPGYRFPGVDSPTMSIVLGGILGVLIVFILASVVSRSLKPRT
jgi:cobalt/nickel transport system permease protein